MNAIITRINHSKHKEIMVRLLHDIYSNKILKDKLVFKGGTSLYLFYGLDRFSTDLDFDLISGDETIILKELEKIASKYGKIKDIYNKRYTIFLLLSYGEIDHNIKIEINKRGIIGKYEIKNLIGINVLTMDLESMTANKLIALTNRNALANRDLYDIDFIFKNNFLINEEIIKEKTGLSQKDYFRECLVFLNTLDKKYSTLDGLGAVLDEKQKFYVKHKLLDYLKKEFALRSL